MDKIILEDGNVKVEYINVIGDTPDVVSIKMHKAIQETTPDGWTKYSFNAMYLEKLIKLLQSVELGRK